MRTLALILGCATALSLAAHAQPTSPIEAFLIAENKGCDLFGYREYHRAAVPGLAEPVIIAAYTLEGCGGGNSAARTVGVFQVVGGKVARFRAPRIDGPALDDKAAVTLQGDRMTIRSLAYGSNDPRCCPSVVRTTSFRIAQGTVTPVR